MGNGLYFGIDVGGTAVKMSLYSSKEDSMVENCSISSIKNEDENILIGNIVRKMKEMSAEAGVSISEVSGIGIGIPGPVTADGKVLKCANLGWDIVDLTAIIKELTGVENVEAGNDANVAALGEIWKGAAAGYKDAVMVTLGTGVGGGIVIDGHIRAGHRGAAGEIGHITVEPEESEACGCGCRGCLEQYASATGIVDIAKKRFGICKENLTAKDIFDAAKAGDEKALKTVDIFAAYLGTALSNIANVIAPEIFIIGGGVSAAGNIIIEKVMEYYEKNSMYALRDIPARLAKLGNMAGMYGAIKMVIDR